MRRRSHAINAADHLINFKVTKEEHEAILRNAQQFTRGNVSEWLRYIGTKPYRVKVAPAPDSTVQTLPDHIGLQNVTP